MALDLGTLTSKANEYKRILKNTTEYRKEWPKTIKPLLENTLQEILDQTDIEGNLVINDQIENLESIVLDLGRTASGINENIEDTNIKRMMIKNNGNLIYQQLFNGKVMVMILPPFIEGYGQAKPPHPVEILRPHELTSAFIIRHVETFLKEITEWEDYDDDKTSNKVAFNPIGFQKGIDTEKE